MPLKVDGDPGYDIVTDHLTASETLPLIVPDTEPHQCVWKPMTREELASAAGGPGWKKLRSGMVLFFWLGWLAMLGAAVVGIVRSPRPGASARRWWQTEVFYRLQPSLLLDIENTGSGALHKVSGRLPYLRSLGIGVLILEGLFRHDVTPLNLTEIDQNLGTLVQFHQLITDSHNTGVRVILDLCGLNLFNRTEFSNQTDAFVYVQNSVRYWLEQGVSGFEICDPDPGYSQKTWRECPELAEACSTEGDDWIVMLRQTGASSPGFSVLETRPNTSLVQVLLSEPLVPISTHPLPAAELTKVTETRLRRLQTNWLSWTVDWAGAGDLKEVIMVLMMTLPGTAIITCGDEISPTTNASVYLSEDDKTNRDSRQKENQRRWRALFRSLSRTRTHEEALLFGNLTFLPVNSPAVGSASANSTTIRPLAYLRSWACAHFLVMLHFGSEPVSLDPDWAPSLPERGVFVTSTGLDRFGSSSRTRGREGD
ncbi:hypothetical protein P4O66_003243 [Electrophorus voltai]|uniref:Solute carrier family 3 member 2 N-terminal domain-containing protein n=1 Tax=Electrophorus voltai TaxID=2609070 RepID=A0AAD8YTX5_9TELE|nr:hypothetical protein P4O66_003243 [Electrophorus voltai]